MMPVRKMPITARQWNEKMKSLQRAVADSTGMARLITHEIPTGRQLDKLMEAGRTHQPAWAIRISELGNKAAQKNINDAERRELTRMLDEHTKYVAEGRENLARTERLHQRLETEGRFLNAILPNARTAEHEQRLGEISRKLRVLQPKVEMAPAMYAKWDKGMQAFKQMRKLLE